MKRVAIAAVFLILACNRTAESYDEGTHLDEDELEDLRVSACEAACETMDRCDPNRFVGLDPPVCFERCMTLMPTIYEENQCGSRELQYLSCLGGLDCEEFELWDYVTDYEQYQATYECVAEFGHARHCDPHDPFDIDEDNSQYP